MLLCLVTPCCSPIILHLPRPSCLAQAVLEQLADAIPADRIADVGQKLYERFRPEWQGWGQKGELDLDAIRQLKETWEKEV